MSTIAKRLREIAERMPTAVQFGAGYALNQDKKALLSIIEELEAAPAADAVPDLPEHEAKHEAEIVLDLQCLARDGEAGFWPRSIARATLGMLQRRDTTIAALQAQIASLRAQTRRAEDVVEAAKHRIAELETRQVPLWFLAECDGDDEAWSDAQDAYEKAAGCLRGHLEWRDRVRAAVRSLLAAPSNPTTQPPEGR